MSKSKIFNLRLKDRMNLWKKREAVSIYCFETASFFSLHLAVTNKNNTFAALNF
jgi:hypothetical protein